MPDLNCITQMQTQRRRLISVTNFTRRLAENPHRKTLIGLSINCFLVVFLFLIFVAFFVVNFQMLPSELCGQFVV